VNDEVTGDLVIPGEKKTFTKLTGNEISNFLLRKVLFPQGYIVI
jgi:hypothetical protein